MADTPESQIIMYGTDWCPDCITSKIVLNKLKATYAFVNIDKDSAAEEVVLKHNSGSRSVPTIIFPDNSVLTEPTRRELTAKVISLDLAKNT